MREGPGVKRADRRHLYSAGSSHSRLSFHAAPGSGSGGAGLSNGARRESRRGETQLTPLRPSLRVFLLCMRHGANDALRLLWCACCFRAASRTAGGRPQVDPVPIDSEPAMCNVLLANSKCPACRKWRRSTAQMAALGRATRLAEVGAPARRWLITSGKRCSIGDRVLQYHASCCLLAPANVQQRRADLGRNGAGRQRGSERDVSTHQASSGCHASADALGSGKDI